jgi:hypothetical protein
MLDINNKQITEGQFLKVIGCKTKNDNGIYIVNKQYEKGDYCLYKVLQNGEVSKTKYNIYFLDDKHDKEKQVTIITKEELKQAAKEVKAYIDGKTAKETIYTFSKAENQTLEGLQEGQIIHFIKCVQWQGHINSQRGKYIISKIENGSFRLHLLGAKGGEIADNMNGYYQFTPIHINLTSETIQQLFDEDYIEILERHVSTKGEQVKSNIKQSVKTVPHDEPKTAKTEEKQVNEELHIEPEKAVEAKQEQKNTKQKKDIASLCSQCKNFNVNCKGMDAVWTGCVCYNKDSILPTVEMLTEQPSTEQTQKVDTEYKSMMTESTETEITADEQQENTNNGLATEYHAIKEQNTEQEQQRHTRVIKAVYYPINEANAKTAKTINSFYDYTTDEATKAYKAHIAEVEVIAQQKAEQYPDHAGDIQALLNKYSKKYADWKNRYYAIECMCPSVMICGAGNFPVRKKEKQNKARDKHMQEYEYIQSILAKIENIGSQREQIKSSDENAIDKLQAKIDELTADLERAKAMNKYYRKNKTMLGFEGLTDEQATKIDNAITNAYSFEKQPVPSFELASIRNKIKTAEGRIAEIKRLKESAEQNTENQEQSIYKSDVCQVVENTELMRIQLLFDGKPSDEIRNILKSNGFRWSPSNKAWQRQLTDNARYTTKRVLKQLEEQQAS